MSFKKIQQLLKTYEVADKEYDQHDEMCDWIYGNCNCRKNRGESYD